MTGVTSFGMYNMSHTDYDIEMAAQKARKLARENFEAGKPYENPYSTGDVIHYTYASEWYRLAKVG